MVDLLGIFYFSHMCTPSTKGIQKKWNPNPESETGRAPVAHFAPQTTSDFGWAGNINLFGE
jgi:hypothetical protein